MKPLGKLLSFIFAIVCYCYAILDACCSACYGSKKALKQMGVARR